MNQIASCGWLLEWARWSYLAHLGLPAVSGKKIFPKILYLASFFGQDGWILVSFFFCVFMDQDGCFWTLTPSQSLNAHKKKNLANIQPSWPHTCSITHTNYMASSANRQDELNHAMWLATQAGKTEPSCPLGTTRCNPQKKFPRKPYNKSFIDQVCSVKMAGYCQVLFCKKGTQ